MPNTIYATFLNQSDAERAAGALLDHGITSADISFIVPERMTSGPTHFSGAPIPTGPDSSTPMNAPASLHAQPVTAAWVGSAAAPGSSAEVQPAPGYAYDTQGLPAPDPSRVALTDHPGTQHYARSDGEAVLNSSTGPAVGLTRTTIAANAPMDVVQTDHDHIIDVNRKEPDAARGLTTTTPADAAKGAAEGAGIGLGLGIALGIATVLVPGIGLVAGAGALVAGLAGATAAAGAVAGGAFGFLHDTGLPPHAVHRLEGSLKKGEPILSVHVNGSVAQGEIVLLLEKYGATSAEAF